MDLPPGKVTIPEGVVRRNFGEEEVLLHLATGHYHGLNAVGKRLVDEMVSTGSASDAAATVAAEFRQPVERVQGDLERLLEELLSRGLVVVS